jgi:polysaccharide deacetylase family protein (PEP-CTERM system associated)
MSFPTQTAQAVPFITVVVPVRNEAPFIRATLEQVLAQDYDVGRFEVIVADGRSTDGTPAIVRALQSEYPNLRLLDNPRRWSSAARNRAVRAARGDLIVVVDGHCDLGNPGYLRELADAFARSGADCVGRPQPLDVRGATTVQRAIAAARSSWLGHHPDSYIYTSAEQFVRPQSVAVAYRREVFDRVGLFDESFDACEDVEFNHRVERAGLRCFFTPRVRAHYYPRASLAGLFRQMVRYGRGRVRLLRKHPETFTLGGFLPALFLAGVVLGAGLAWLAGWLAVVYAGALAVYGAAVAGVSAAICWQGGEIRLLAWLPAVFAAIHCGAGYGILRELAAGLRRRGGRVADWTPATVSLSVVRTSVPADLSEGVNFAEYLAVPFGGEGPGLGGQEAPVLNALTVDVEDYFHVSGFETCVDRTCWESFEPRVEAGTAKILEALDRAWVRGTFFILGWVAKRHPDLVRRIRRAGHEIACHSYWHRLVYRQTPQAFREDLRQARDVLQDLTGEPVRTYRAPSFSITRRSLWALDVLIEEGFAIDSSIYPTRHDRYGLAGAPLQPHRICRPGGEIWEFPLPVYRRLGYPLPIGGGGYLRLYPYRFTRHGLRAINRKGRPFIAYVHPWELDPEQPRLSPGRLRSFRHYINLHRTGPRLVKLLRDFRFGTIGQVLAGLDQVPLAA